MLSKEEVLNIFTEAKALLTGHFRLTSGRHSNRYMQCAQVLKFPEYAQKLCADLAAKFQGQKIDIVVGPAMGGIIVSYEVARALGVPSIFCEREQGQMKLRRGFTIEPGANVLVVEDVVTTGGSVKEVMNVIRELGGNIVGVGVLVDRSNGAVDFGVPLHAELTMDIQSWEADDCPLCKEGIPVVKPGSREVK
ncbi:orotate phosphoribosyltransferase [Thermincola potens]|uniref:Orotate phosphoribosyltransferase n=1 Tax=Thermincola potens (strain JR) TaxID=635013 RepID=D5X7V5_THEPJ|nr:orotate phosphoribosyltransferase [Thermincola potens]ADG82675.1 orotate phosphoribosyltransferase [Thermincola potens JR]